MTPIDLLFKYGKVYHVDMGDCHMITKIPKKVVDLRYYPDMFILEKSVSRILTDPGDVKRKLIY